MKKLRSIKLFTVRTELIRSSVGPIKESFRFTIDPSFLKFFFWVYTLSALDTYTVILSFSKNLLYTFVFS